MRYGKDHKQATRRRIIETAGRRFKRDGIDGSGVAPLMADAGLTNGAFYAHFDSKDDLVASVVADQLRGQCGSLSVLAPGRAGVEQIVRAYLSVEHRDSPEVGCPSAALLDEIARSADATKRAYTDGVLAIIDDIATRLAPHDPQSARVKVLSVYAGMVGTLQLSRALADQQLADKVLDQGIENVLTLLDVETGAKALDQQPATNAREAHVAPGRSPALGRRAGADAVGDAANRGAGRVTHGPIGMKHRGEITNII